MTTPNQPPYSPYYPPAGPNEPWPPAGPYPGSSDMAYPSGGGFPSGSLPPARKSRRVIWLASAVVLALIGVVVVFAISGQGDDDRNNTAKPETSSSLKEQPKNWVLTSADRGVWKQTIGTWFVADMLVMATELDVIAYSRATGEQRWKVTSPKTKDGAGGKTAFCGANPTVGKELIALAFGPTEGQTETPACTDLVALNVKTGKQLWHIKIADASEGVGREAASGVLVEIINDIVVVGWGATLFGFNTTAGEKKWSYPLTIVGGRPCPLLDMVSIGEKFFISVSCYGAGFPVILAVGNANDGNLEIKKTITDITKEGVEKAYFASTSPLILITTPPNISKSGSYLVLTDSLEVTAEILTGELTDPERLEYIDYSSVTTDRAQRRYYRIAVNNETLVTVTFSPGNQTNKLVAFDIASGAKRWETTIDDSIISSPVVIDDSTIIVEATAQLGKGDEQVIRVNLSDGKKISTDSYPIDHEGSRLIEECRFFWVDKKIYAVRWAGSARLPAIMVIGK